MTGQGLRSRLSDFFRNDSDGNLFYGWRLVALGTLIVLIGRELAGSLVEQWLVNAITEDFWIGLNWLHPAVLGIGAATRFPVWAVAGWGVDRYGPRRTVQIGLPLISIVILLAAFRVPGLLALSFIWVGTVGLLGAWLPTVTVLNNWFRRRLVIALAVILFAEEVGGEIVRWLITPLVFVAGWTATAAAAALVISAVAAPLSGRIFNRPEDYGQRPDGAIAASVAALPDFRWLEAMKSRQFWMVVVAIGCLSATETVSSVYLTNMATDWGRTRSTIGLLLGIERNLGVIFILAGGWVSYKMPIRYALSAFALVQAIGAVPLLLGNGSLPLLILGFALMGIGTGMMTAPGIAVVGIYFGRRSFGANTVTLFMFASIAGTLSLPAVGAFLDATGEIAPVIIVIAIVNAAAAVLFFRLGQPRLAPSQRSGNPAVN